MAGLGHGMVLRAGTAGVPSGERPWLGRARRLVAGQALAEAEQGTVTVGGAKPLLLIR